MRLDCFAWNTKLIRGLGVQISLGGSHSAALSSTGVVYVWGRGEHGRLGRGDYVTCRRPVIAAVPSPPASPVGPSPLSGRRPRRRACIVQLSCGGRHTLALAAKEPKLVKAPPPLPVVRTPSMSEVDLELDYPPTDFPRAESPESEDRRPHALFDYTNVTAKSPPPSRDTSIALIGTPNGASEPLPDESALEETAGEDRLAEAFAASLGRISVKSASAGDLSTVSGDMSELGLDAEDDAVLGAATA
jgi:hypothetical protein